MKPGLLGSHLECGARCRLLNTRQVLDGSADQDAPDHLPNCHRARARKHLVAEVELVVAETTDGRCRG